MCSRVSAQCLQDTEFITGSLPTAKDSYSELFSVLVGTCFNIWMWINVSYNRYFLWICMSHQTAYWIWGTSTIIIMVLLCVSSVSLSPPFFSINHMRIIWQSAACYLTWTRPPVFAMVVFTSLLYSLKISNIPLPVLRMDQRVSRVFVAWRC